MVTSLFVALVAIWINLTAYNNASNLDDCRAYPTIDTLEICMKEMSREYRVETKSFPTDRYRFIGLCSLFSATD